MTPIYILEAVRSTGFGTQFLVDPFSHHLSFVHRVWPFARELQHDRILFPSQDSDLVRVGDGHRWLDNAGCVSNWTDGPTDIDDVWINSPWSTHPIADTALSVANAPCRSVMLLAASTYDNHWRTVIWPRADWVCFLYGRIPFAMPGAPEPRTGLPIPIALAGFNWETGIEPDTRRLRRRLTGLESIGKLVIR